MVVATTQFQHRILLLNLVDLVVVVVLLDLQHLLGLAILPQLHHLKDSLVVKEITVIHTQEEVVVVPVLLV
tara:strand:- start:350 stop:562 length:213 start_codon:yes stop_codon:yes gene_type:complete